MKRKLLVSLFVAVLLPTAEAATLGQHVYAEAKANAVCTAVLQANIVTSVAGRSVQISWSGVPSGTSAYAWSIWSCAGAACSTYTQIARWPDLSSDWLTAVAAAGNSENPDAGVHTVTNLPANTHKFQLRFAKAPGYYCQRLVNRTLHLQEIIP